MPALTQHGRSDGPSRAPLSRSVVHPPNFLGIKSKQLRAVKDRRSAILAAAAEVIESNRFISVPCDPGGWQESEHT